MPDGLVGGGGGVVRGGAQLLVLLSLLPLQYWLTTPGTEASRQAALGQFLSGVGSWRERLATWCGSVLAHLSARGATGSGVAKEPDEVGTQPSREEKEKGYFASSTEPRLPRASHVHFRVGQVLRHKKWGYRGVIVGWDLVAKAPSEWLDQMHPKDKPVSFLSLPCFQSHFPNIGCRQAMLSVR